MLYIFNRAFYYTTLFLSITHDSFLGANSNNSTGNKIRLVSVATNSVTEVSHPKDLVPPKLLRQKIMNPAINTIEVYTILKPVFLMVAQTVAEYCYCRLATPVYNLLKTGW